MATYLYLEKEEPMTQSIVNFLVYQDGSAVNPLIPDARVFDYRIGADAQSTYEALMNALASTLANYQNQSITQDEAVIEISRLINSLNNWSKMQVSTINGIQTTSTFEFLNKNGTSLSIPSTTMNTEMATAVDRMIRILRSAGWDPTLQPPAHASGSQVQQAMRDAIAKLIDPVQTSLYPISTYISSGLAAAQNALLVAASGQAVDTSTTSLQQLLMVEYVSYGNKILYDEMNGLSTAINYNQNALAYLNSLQNLMNQKTPEQFLMALDQLSGSSINYDTFESQSFNKTLGTTANFTEDQLANYVASLTQDPYYSTVVPQLSALQTSTASLNTTLTTQTTGLNSILTTLSSSFATLKTQIGSISTTEIIPFVFTLRPTTYYSNSDFDTLQTDITTCQNLATQYTAAYTTYSSDPEALKTLSTNLSNAMTQLKNHLDNFVTRPQGLDAFAKQLYCVYYHNHSNTNFQSQVPSWANFLTTYYGSIPTVEPVENPKDAPTSGIPPTPSWFSTDDTTLNSASSAAQTVITQLTALLNTSGYTPGMTAPSTGTAADAFLNSTTQTFNATIDQIKTNLQALISHMGTDASGSALASALRTVYNDFTNAGSVVTWVKDFTSATQQGNYQTNLNNAVVASQALNDAKREELQRVMFVFEEFYKSAMALLSRLTQLIEKMADSINR